MAPPITIVTPSFNQAAFLEDTLRSILGQNVSGLELIVIDGGSTDGSRDILERYSDRITYWVSERDRGQAHAINKGLARATGDIFGFLNSDDLFLPGALSAVLARFAERPSCTWLCGQTMLFGEGHETSLPLPRIPRSAEDLLCFDYKAGQPGMFWRREILEAGVDETYRYCFDHELYVRLALAGHVCESLELPVAAYRLHAQSKTVGEASGFDVEFDRIAERYLDRLTPAGRRRCRGLLALRRAWKATD